VTLATLFATLSLTPTKAKKIPNVKVIKNINETLFYKWLDTHYGREILKTHSTQTYSTRKKGLRSVNTIYFLSNELMIDIQDGYVVIAHQEEQEAAALQIIQQLKKIIKHQKTKHEFCLISSSSHGLHTYEIDLKKPKLDFTYTNTANKIFASSEEGDFTYNYKLVNGQLIISGGVFPQPVTFTKSKNSISGTSGNTKIGSIDKSIVGTWCWANTSGTYTNASSSSTRFIVINADGTYQYTYEGSISGSGGGYYGGSSSQSADHGTWKLNGNTISVVSASEGAASYSFQKKNHPKTGDPMIVIDGDAYVTYYRKNPW
jgi:hypothetical protein